MDNTKTQFVLKGFRQVVDFRDYLYERIESDRTRSQFTVRADLALARRHGIPLQELPLLCQSVLGRSQAGGAVKVVVFTETDMRDYSAVVAERAAAAKARRPARRPRPTEAVGAGWRTMPVR